MCERVSRHQSRSFDATGPRSVRPLISIAHVCKSPPAPGTLITNQEIVPVMLGVIHLDQCPAEPCINVVPHTIWILSICLLGTAGCIPSVVWRAGKDKGPIDMLLLLDQHFGISPKMPFRQQSRTNMFLNKLSPALYKSIEVCRLFADRP